MSSPRANLWGNTFRVPNSDNTITRLASGPFDHARNRPNSSYPPLGTLVDGVLQTQGDPDRLERYYSNDALWGYAIRARVVDLPMLQKRSGYSTFIHRLFDMGLNDWGHPERPANSAPANIFFRYTACMANELFKYSGTLEDKVSILPLEGSDIRLIVGF
jgi:hypothetical protein